MDRSVWPSIRKWTRGAIGVKPPTVVLQCECLRHHYLAGWVGVLEVLEMICIEPVEPIPGCRTIEGVDPHCGYGGSMTNLFTPRLRLVHAQTQHKPTNHWTLDKPFSVRTNLSQTSFICSNSIYHRHMSTQAWSCLGICFSVSSDSDGHSWNTAIVTLL